MKILFCCLAALSLLLCTISGAQQAEPAAPPASKIVLHKGTEVALKLAQAVNSKAGREGELIEFVVAEPVKVADIVVVEVGSRAIGIVSHSAKPNFSGDPGEVAVKLTFLKAGKTKVPIRGSTFETGDYRVMIRGTQAEIKAGTTVKAYVDSDTEVELAKPATPPASAPSSELIGPNVPAEEPPTRADTIRLENGTGIRLLLLEPISSKTAKAGDPVKLRVLEDVKVGDLIVIENRAPATAVIEEAKAAGMAWRKGKLGIRVKSVTLINHQEWPVEAWTKTKGLPTNAVEGWGSLIYATQGLALFALPLAPLQHGNQATMRRAMELGAVTKGEIMLDRASVEAFQPKPETAGSGPATVTFYFPEFEKARFHEIWCGPAKMGQLKQGRKISVKFIPGRYSFHVRKKAPGTEIDLEAGMHYYARMGFLQAIVASGEQATGISVVPYDIGELEAMDTREMQFKAMPDMAGLKPITASEGLEEKK